jgi:hypothetical protein
MGRTYLSGKVVTGIAPVRCEKTDRIPLSTHPYQVSPYRFYGYTICDSIRLRFLRFEILETHTHTGTRTTVYGASQFATSGRSSLASGSAGTRGAQGQSDDPHDTPQVSRHAYACAASFGIELHLDAVFPFEGLDIAVVVHAEECPSKKVLVARLIGRLGSEPLVTEPHGLLADMEGR